MNLHEYQSKEIFRHHGLPVPAGRAAASPDQAARAAQELGGARFVVKAQVHAGGRGKAGGVKLAATNDEVRAHAQTLLGTRLVTHQTGAAGQPVHQVLVESATGIAREIYLGAVIDRAARRLTIMVSSEGGVEIEQVAARSPEKILRFTVDPLFGLMPWQSRAAAFALGLEGDAAKQLAAIMAAVARLFVERDLSLVEINPLVVTTDGRLVCLDAKIVVDDNALYRQPEIAALRDVSQENEKEVRAREHDLNYIALDGDIGCMVNGAGLAMATMDTIHLYGAKPANFLDVGGGTTRERVAEAFKILVSDTNVRAILVNIFGGIVRCDLIAEGIIGAVQEVGVSVPVVVRLEGTNAEKGLALLAQSGLKITTAAGLAEAAEKVVAAART